MSDLDDLSQFLVVLFEQIQDPQGFVIGSVLGCSCKLSSSQLMFLTGGQVVVLFRLVSRIAGMVVRLRSN